MAKLETQINQIYLINPESKKSCLVLYEEVINPNNHLFILAELKDVQKKTGSNDIKKILRITVETFKANKKLNKSILFESSLAQINQSLADLAFEGRKSWLGKFSSLIALKSSDSLYLANTGLVSAFLKRGNQINKILAAEKSRLHPLKTFANFISGKIADDDELVLTTHDIFNFISAELFEKLILTEGVYGASLSISKILKESKKEDDVFGTFLMKFQTTQQEVSNNVVNEILYAPFPEDMSQEKETRFNIPFWKLNLKKISLSSFSIPSLKNLSPARRFFAVSFVLFALLFLTNIAVFGIKHVSNKRIEKVSRQFETFTQKLNEVESALIYKNDEQAIVYLSQAKEEFEKLKKLNTVKAKESELLFNQVSDKINRITIINDPRIIAELKYSPKFLSRAGSGFLLANDDPKTISIYDGQNLKNLLLLNNVDQGIRGIIHAQTFGNLVMSKAGLYRINQKLSQFDAMKTLPNSDLFGLKFISPNRLYSIDKNKNQVLRFVLNKDGSLSSPQSLLKGSPNLKDALDLGVDADIYILFPSKASKFVNGNEQNFKLIISEPLSFANRIFVASNIYILESGKKRLLIFNKNGNLLNQLRFPNMKEVKDLYVDENQRFIYLLEENKLLEITF